MSRFPVDAPKQKVIRAFEALGFQILREREHISMLRENADGSHTPLTLPNHPKLKAPTLRTVCTQVGITRDQFLDAYENS
jgi:predicted RNA binding protein YcfA (HicA-like mRNA interferase family)